MVFVTTQLVVKKEIHSKQVELGVVVSCLLSTSEAFIVRSDVSKHKTPLKRLLNMPYFEELRQIAD